MSPQHKLIASSSLGEIYHLIPDEPPIAPVTAPQAEPEPWPEMDAAAFHGIAGDFVNSLDAHTESDRVAVLIQFLAMFGNMVGSAPYYLVENDRHHANLYALLCGKTAKARKGTSEGRVSEVAQEADTIWFAERRFSGLSSGEGFIYPVRDQAAKWNAKEKTIEIVDPGVTDKRMLVVESEFAGPLTVMERAGNNLSIPVRDAWDCKKLQTMTKNSPLRATSPHISIIGHITQDELRARMTRTDMANGFANRFLFALVKRSKFLPHGGHFPESEKRRFQQLIAQTLEVAQRIGRVTMSDIAAEAWSGTYETLSADRPGLLGAITARAEAQTIRLALIYCLLDKKQIIEPVHLEAALAVWSYCESSASYIFGDSLGDPVADDVSAALRRSAAGMTRTDINNLFGRHRSSDQIGAALGALLKASKAKFETKQTGGRPVETWFAIGRPV